MVRRRQGDLMIKIQGYHYISLYNKTRYDFVRRAMFWNMIFLVTFSEKVTLLFDASKVDWRAKTNFLTR